MAKRDKSGVAAQRVTDLVSTNLQPRQTTGVLGTTQPMSDTIGPIPGSSKKAEAHALPVYNEPPPRGERPRFVANHFRALARKFAIRVNQDAR